MSLRDTEGTSPIAIGALIGGVTGAIQDANQGSGWTTSNAQNIAVGAALGAAIGAMAGAAPSSWGLLGGAVTGAVGGGAGSAASQLAGNDPFSWCAVGTQAGIGAISGVAGWLGGLRGALNYVAANTPASATARGWIVQNAINLGATTGAVASGATQTALNLPISASLGGFNPGGMKCGCSF